MICYLGLGSNLDCPQENIDRAVALLHQGVGCVTARSCNYISRAVGFDSSHLFVNAAVAIETPFCPEELLHHTADIEQTMGKRFRPSRSLPYTDRIIDIDLLLVPGVVYRSERLILPHPHLHERDFVLLPLAEIAPNEIHPLFLLSIQELSLKLTVQPGFAPSVIPV